MAATLQSLTLEEGQSNALRAALACVAEASAGSGGPRYAARVSAELGRAVVCRSYARPVLELTHLVGALSANGGRYENLFWGVDRASASAFRQAFDQLSGTSDAFSVGHNGVVCGPDENSFTVSYGRMPFLAALLEFLITALGFAEVDDLFAPLRGPGRADETTVRETAKAIQRHLYDYLKTHLPPAQQQRRERHFLAYTSAHAGNKSGADAIDDGVVLGYWQGHATDPELEVRTFRGVYETASRLIVALDAAADRLAGRYPRTVGTDMDSGEVDPADLEAVVAEFDPGECPLDRVQVICGEQVKFVNATEADTLGEVPFTRGIGSRIPVSVIRNAVWGAVQVRLSAGLRRGEENLIGMLPADADGAYERRLDDYAKLAAGLDRMLMAALWGLHQARHPVAIDLALALAPDLDWSAFSPCDDGGDNLVSLAAAKAAQQFFDCAPDAKGDELQALLADARRIWRDVNRAGFKDVGDSAAINAMAEAVPAVRALAATVRAFTDRDAAGIDWPAFEANDLSAVGDVLRDLYDIAGGGGVDAG